VGLGSAVSFPMGSGAKPQWKANLMHFSLNIVTSGGTNFTNFLESDPVETRLT